MSNPATIHNADQALRWDPRPDMLKYEPLLDELKGLVEGTPYTIEAYNHEIRIEHANGQGLSVIKTPLGVVLFLIDNPTPHEYNRGQLDILDWMLDAARVIELDIKAQDLKTTNESQT